MLLMRPRRNTITPVGLDIGFRGVRGVQLKPQGDNWVVLHQARFERNTANRDAVPDSEEVERRVRACFATGDFHGRTSITSLTTPDIEHHAIELPTAVLSQGSSSLSAVMRQEMQRLVSPANASVQTAYWVLPDARPSSPNVIGTVARDAIIERTLTACTKARVDCACVDAAAAALSRFGSILRPRVAGQVWGVLDLGFLESRLIICHATVPVLVRTAGAGGTDWTSRIAESLEISEKAAETHKQEHGLTVSGRGAASPDRGSVREELGSMLFSALRSDLNKLASEIKRSYEYVMGCYPAAEISDLMLVGGGALLRNLDLYLSSELGITVAGASRYLNEPTCRLTWPDSRTGSMEEMATATGLAIPEEVPHG